MTTPEHEPSFEYTVHALRAPGFVIIHGFRDEMAVGDQRAMVDAHSRFLGHPVVDLDGDDHLDSRPRPGEREQLVAALEINPVAIIAFDR
jgi:hypothetical protein